MELQFGDLADHLDLVPKIVAWHVREWGDSPTASAESEHTLTRRANAGEIPFTVLAFAGNVLVGSASVTWDDLDQEYENEGPWLSGMVVQGPARNEGVGRALLAEVENRTRQLGHSALWLHTAEAHRFYERCGWRVVRAKPGLGYDTVMRKHLRPSPTS